MKKKLRHYIPNVILTILLVFVMMGTEVVILADRIALNPNTFVYISDQQKLDEKGYAKLTDYFRTRANSTGIPESVFLDAFTAEDLRSGIAYNLASSLAYLKGSRAEATTDIDFTKLDAAVTDFFVQYAEENGYEQDEMFQQKLAATISEAQAQIVECADPFRFQTLRANGWLAKGRTAVGYLGTALIAGIAGAALLIVLLILLNLHQAEHLCYWIGLASFTAGLLLAAPCIYLTATDYFSGFAFKDPQVFPAIVTLLRLLTSRCLTIAIVTFFVGIIGMAGFAFIRAVQREEEE